MVFKTTLSFLFIILLSASALAQSGNFRAQANYYTAKESYHDRKESNDKIGNPLALEKCNTYLEKAKDNLNGTNKRIQYLYIMSLYKQREWVDCKFQMEIYFDLVEERKRTIAFAHIVDDLSDDEIRDLTMIMDEVYEKADPIIEANTITCDNCSGKGSIMESFMVSCDDCLGKGSRKCASCGGDGKKTCRKCNGKGRVKWKCNQCNGRGGHMKHYGGPGTAQYRCNGYESDDCPKCGWSGKEKCSSCEHGERNCRKCNGKGEVEEHSTTTCQKCKGKGKMYAGK